jgi:hypothetical protein
MRSTTFNVLLAMVFTLVEAQTSSFTPPPPPSVLIDASTFVGQQVTSNGQPVQEFLGIPYANAPYATFKLIFSVYCLTEAKPIMK